MNTRASPEPLSDPDRQILAFAAAHRLVLASQVQALLDASERVTQERLAALSAARLLRHDRVLHAQAGHYQITRRGLTAIDSELPAPRFELLRSYRHEIGVAWLWLAASGGRFGPVERVVTEREMRSLDGARKTTERPSEQREPSAPPGDSGEPRFGVRLARCGAGEANPLHYPELLLILQQGRIAIELPLFAPGPRRLEQVVAAYGADPDVVVALYLADDPAVRRMVEATAARLGLSDPTHVQRVQFGPTAPRAAPQ